MNIIGTDGKHYEVPTPAYQAIIQQGLAEIVEAESVLDREDMEGIYAEFENLPDAINQMAMLIKELEESKTTLEITLHAIRKLVEIPKPGDPNF